MIATFDNLIQYLMIETLLDWDTKLLLWLNSFHHPAIDPVVYLCSQTWFWIPLYAFLLWLVVKDHRKNSWIVAAAVALTITFTDQVTSSLMKPYFERLRPSHEASLAGKLHVVQTLSGEVYTGGRYGFSSGHAANTFGTATFLVLLMSKTRRWIYWLYLWAALMTYTRIYMGVHYPGDILTGASIGVLAGWLGVLACRWGLDRRKAA
jgi:undecaprenyl-diphosphatase